MAGKRRDNESEMLAEVFANVMGNGSDSLGSKTAKLSKKAKKGLKKAKRTAKHSARKSQTFITNRYADYQQSPNYSGNLLSVEESADRKRFIKPILITFLAIASIVLVGGFIRVVFGSNSPFNESVTENLPYAPFYPKNVPFGYELQKDDIKKPKEDVVIYGFADERGSVISVSLQPIPKEFDLEKATSFLENKRELETPVGKAIIGDSRTGNTVSNIFSGDTWIIVSFTKGSLLDESIDTMLRSFKKV